ncbi:headcase protein-like [Schistocerca serialis cubense]|uniref:headcase protein-like n=1 Tax=Schistocerca serialis cubense TaxID=2023355 RepID=UPI00214E1139|nr:headcase protein-like [Schistocerca serialis cubense]
MRKLIRGRVFGQRRGGRLPSPARTPSSAAQVWRWPSSCLSASRPSRAGRRVATARERSAPHAARGRQSPWSLPDPPIETASSLHWHSAYSSPKQSLEVSGGTSVQKEGATVFWCESEPDKTTVVGGSVCKSCLPCCGAEPSAHVHKPSEQQHQQPAHHRYQQQQQQQPLLPRQTAQPAAVQSTAAERSAHVCEKRAEAETLAQPQPPAQPQPQALHDIVEEEDQLQELSRARAVRRGPQQEQQRRQLALSVGSSPSPPPQLARAAKSRPRTRSVTSTTSSDTSTTSCKMQAEQGSIGDLKSYHNRYLRNRRHTLANVR